MKKIYIVLLVFIFTFVSCFAFNSALKKTEVTAGNIYQSKHTVVIDAGHGGKDAGTIGVDGTNEKDINLSIALILYDYLMVSGINAVMTRDGDYLVYNKNDDTSRSDLYNRMDFINSIDNSVLLSIHQNHFEDEREWGMQIWYSANTPESKTIADSILNVSKEFIQSDNNRENKESDNSYYLLYKAKVPSVMIECGFMSNTDENNRLKNKEYQKNIAYSILVGISGEI